MSDLDPSEPKPIDPAAQRRARLILAVLLVLVIGAGVGGYLAWKKHTERRDAELAAAILAERESNSGGRRRAQRPAIDPDTAQRVDEAIAQRTARDRMQQFERTLGRYRETPEAERDAFIDRTIAARRRDWRLISQTPPASADPAAAEFVERLQAGLQRVATTQRAARPPSTRAARRTPATTTAPAR